MKAGAGTIDGDFLHLFVEVVEAVHDDFQRVAAAPLNRRHTHGHVGRIEDAGTKASISIGVGRCDWGDLQRIQLRRNDGTAQSIVVGGGSHGGGNQQPVSVEFLYQGTVDFDAQVGEVGVRTSNDDFVHAPKLIGSVHRVDDCIDGPDTLQGVFLFLVGIQEAGNILDRKSVV